MLSSAACFVFPAKIVPMLSDGTAPPLGNCPSFKRTLNTVIFRPLQHRYFELSRLPLRDSEVFSVHRVACAAQREEFSTTPERELPKGGRPQCGGANRILRGQATLSSTYLCFEELCLTLTVAKTISMFPAILASVS